MPTCLGHVEETLVLVSGPSAGSSLSPRNASDGRIPHRLGSGHEWPPRPRSVERSPSSLALQLPGDAGRVSGTETLLPGPMRHALGRSACQPCRCSRAQRSPASPYLSLPPRNVAELRSSPPLQGSLQQLVRPSPAGHPLQDTELAAQTTPEASLERLAPLADYLAAWKLLPNVSAWVLRTVERGYRIQFSAPPLPFNGVFPTVVSPEQGLVMEQEVETLLRKEAIEVVPLQDGESGFYSRYFIVPKKDGGLRPILDLRLLNRSVMRLKFKMLTINQVVSQIRSEDWFVTIDLKDAYFHVSILPQHRKFLRFAFRGEAYQYRVLPFGLALSPCTFTKCVDAALAPLRLWGIRTLNYIDDWLILAQSEHMAVQHRDVVLAHLKELGLRLNAKKSVLSPLQRTTYLGKVWDSTLMQARLSSARIKSILTAVMRVTEGRSLTVKQSQRLLALMAAVSNVIPFGLLYMRPLQWWLRTKGFSPRGNPFRMIKVTRQYLRALDMWKKPWFLSQGPVLGAPCRRITLATDASLTGWGAVMSGHPARGLWSSRHLTWHINCLEMLAVFRALKHFLPDLIGHHVLVRTDNTAVVYYVNHQGGLCSRPLYKLAHQILVWSQDKLLLLMLCSWASQIGSRHPVEAGAEARGMDASPGGGEADLESFWPGSGGPLRDSGECAMSPLVLSDSSSSTGAGCHGTDVAEASSVCFSPDRSAPGSSGEGVPGWGPSSFSSPILAGPSMVLGPDSLLDGSPWEIPVRRDLFSQAGPSFTLARSCGSYGCGL
ncbi:Transposon Ty3-G Gag-Pol polyprotein [Labeo rohita]|uniref:ribonuclease H n=1 Tax=Labeo rohita TaxID=84645 RepID=A0ABQ8M328_LABRO|nr:Transposon Ty3-G Gag-Pol polyprotein [Labeo rohita]